LALGGFVIFGGGPEKRKSWKRGRQLRLETKKKKVKTGRGKKRGGAAPSPGRLQQDSEKIFFLGGPAKKKLFDEESQRWKVS